MPRYIVDVDDAGVRVADEFGNYHNATMGVTIARGGVLATTDAAGGQPQLYQGKLDEPCGGALPLPDVAPTPDVVDPVVLEPAPLPEEPPA